MLRKLYLILRSRGMFVVVDSRDNSVTLSQRLWRHMRHHAKSDTPAQVFMFGIPKHRMLLFGFMMDHEIDTPTQLCDIQYNERYHCIGFETLCPSVGTIFYHYGLPADTRCQLYVTTHHTSDGKLYYQLNRP